MNQRERDLMSRIYGSVGTIGGLTPSNPADIRAISHNLKIATEGAGALRMAISCLGYGDYGDAAEYLDDAESILARRPSSGDQR